MPEPELKAWDCSDHDPIEDWEPKEGPFIYWLALHIGPKGERGEELFYVPVANTLGLIEEKWSERDPELPPVPIVLDDYSWDKVLIAVRDILKQCPEGRWSEIGEWLSRYFDWEFAGYDGAG